MTPPETPGGNRIERKKEETKQKIINTAMNLFKQYGFDATTMEQIANEVDIAKGTLYNYFPVKEAILNEFIQRSFQERNSARIMQIREMTDTRSRLILLLIELMEGIQAQKEIFEKYLVYQIQNMISLRRDDGVKSGEIRNDLPVEILTALFEFVFIEVAQQFYMNPEKFKAHEVIEQCVDLFMNGAKYEN